MQLCTATHRREYAEGVLRETDPEYRYLHVETLEAPATPATGETTSV